MPKSCSGGTKTALRSNSRQPRMQNIDHLNLAYYEANALKYTNATQYVNIDNLYSLFLEKLLPGAKILDVGCGGGRDLSEFKNRGFIAYGIDPSPSLVQIARSRSGCEVIIGNIENIELIDVFDGVWACASLLHLPKKKLPLAIQRIYECLHEHGYFFLSMQAGAGESISSDGRFYSRYEEAELVDVLTKAGFNIQSSWRTTDSLLGRESLKWINIVAHK